jgi:hypothetical protein
MFMRMLVICAVSVFLVSGMPGQASADRGHAAMRSYEGGSGWVSIIRQRVICFVIF